MDFFFQTLELTFDYYYNGIHVMLILKKRFIYCFYIGIKTNLIFKTLFQSSVAIFSNNKKKGW